MVKGWVGGDLRPLSRISESLWSTVLEQLNYGSFSESGNVNNNSYLFIHYWQVTGSFDLY